MEHLVFIQLSAYSVLALGITEKSLILSFSQVFMSSPSGIYVHTSLRSPHTFSSLDWRVPFSLSSQEKCSMLDIFNIHIYIYIFIRWAWKSFQYLWRSLHAMASLWQPWQSHPNYPLPKPFYYFWYSEGKYSWHLKSKYISGICSFINYSCKNIKWKKKQTKTPQNVKNLQKKP